ncbi:MAG: zinc ribbon domain-containing protein [Candidatus Saccharibacteria bacterium]
MIKQCQSCGMPLQTEKAGDCRGTEKNGDKSEKWCKLCYVDGKFIDPDCTLDQMIVIVDNALKEQGSRRLMRWMARKQLPTLERWKTQK